VKEQQLIGRVADALETMDKRLASMEADSANQAAAFEAFVGNLEAMVAGQKKLMELAVTSDERAERLESILSNYTEVVREWRKGQVKFESEVREKLTLARNG
jgi:hypothetical protein